MAVPSPDHGARFWRHDSGFREFKYGFQELLPLRENSPSNLRHSSPIALNAIDAPLAGSGTLAVPGRLR